MDRRDFIKTTAAASGLLFVKPSTAFGYQANSAVRLGLLGCGNRGTAVATSFAKGTARQEGYDVTRRRGRKFSILLTAT